MHESCSQFFTSAYYLLSYAMQSKGERGFGGFGGSEGVRDGVRGREGKKGLGEGGRQREARKRSSKKIVLAARWRNTA